MKTQWPRSADEPGLYMAQTGNSGPPLFLWRGPDCGVWWHVCWRVPVCVYVLELSYVAT